MVYPVCMATKRKANRIMVDVSEYIRDAIDMYAQRAYPDIKITRTAVVHFLLKEALEKKGIKFHPSGEPWMDE